MDDGKGILGDALGEIVGIGRKAAGEIVTTAGQVPVKGLQSLAGATMTPQELEQKKLEDEQKSKAGIAQVQAQLAEQMAQSRHARTQMDTARMQEQPTGAQNSVPTLGTSTGPVVSHKLLERKSDKRHG